MLSRAVVTNLFSTRDQFHGRQFFHGPGEGGEWGDGLGSNASSGEGWGVADEVLLTRHSPPAVWPNS